MRTSALNVWKEEVVALKKEAIKKQNSLNELNSLLREEESQQSTALNNTRSKISANTQTIDSLNIAVQEYDSLISKIVERIAEEAINVPEPTIPEEQSPDTLPEDGEVPVEAN